MPGAAPPGMTQAAWILLILAGVSALVDWAAVATRRHPAEYVFKPLTLALLVGVAVTLQPVDGLQRAYFVTALLFSLAGDVLLMLPGGEREAPAVTRSDGRGPLAPPPDPPAALPAWFDPFALGLAAFLLAHLNYIAGFRVVGPGLDRVALALLAVAVIAVPLGTVISRALVARGEQRLRVPVIAYIAVLSAMTASAVATGSLLASAGAWSFVASDATLAWDRFITPLRWGPTVVAVTYHLAQALLIVSLVR
jgi:alkenylglycerophosphocholine/alkenylglycerophosphoethanolamine hydrolase